MANSDVALTIDIDITPNIKNNKQYRRLLREVEKQLKKSGTIGEKSFNKQSKEINKSTKDLKKLKKEVGSLENGIKSLAKKGLGIGAGVIAANKAVALLEAGIRKVNELIDQSINKAVEFESALTRSMLKLDKAERPKFLDTFDKEIVEISKDYGESTENIAEALDILLGSGVDAASAMGVLRSSVKTAAASNTDLKNIIDLTTTVVGAYGKEWTDVGDIMDYIVKTDDVGKFKNGVQELSQSMGKSMALAKSAGVSFEQVATAFSHLSLKGFNAFETTTLLNNVFTQLARTEVSDKFEQIMGVELRDKQTRKLKEFPVILKEIAVASKGISNLDEVLGAIIPEVRAKNALISLTSMKDGVLDYDNMLKEFDRSKVLGKVDDNWKQVEQTQDRIVKKTNTQIEAYKLTIGKTLQTLPLTFKSVQKDLIATIKDWILNSEQDIKGLAESIANVGGLLVRVFKNVTPIIDLAIRSVSSFLNIISNVGQALSDMLGFTNVDTRSFKEIENSINNLENKKKVVNDLANSYITLQQEINNINKELKSGTLTEEQNAQATNELREKKKELANVMIEIEKIAPVLADRFKLIKDNIDGLKESTKTATNVLDDITKSERIALFDKTKESLSEQAEAYFDVSSKVSAYRKTLDMLERTRQKEGSLTSNQQKLLLETSKRYSEQRLELQKVSKTYQQSIKDFQQYAAEARKAGIDVESSIFGLRKVFELRKRLAKDIDLTDIQANGNYFLLDAQKQLLLAQSRGDVSKEIYNTLLGIFDVSNNITQVTDEAFKVEQNKVEVEKQSKSILDKIGMSQGKITKGKVETLKTIIQTRIQELKGLDDTISKEKEKLKVMIAQAQTLNLMNKITGVDTGISNKAIESQIEAIKQLNQRRINSQGIVDKLNGKLKSLGDTKEKVKNITDDAKKSVDSYNKAIDETAKLVQSAELALAKTYNVGDDKKQQDAMLDITAKYKEYQNKYRGNAESLLNIDKWYNIQKQVIERKASQERMKQLEKEEKERQKQLKKEMEERKKISDKVSDYVTGVYKDIESQKMNATEKEIQAERDKANEILKIEKLTAEQRNRIVKAREDKIKNIISNRLSAIREDLDNTLEDLTSGAIGQVLSGSVVLKWTQETIKLQKKMKEFVKKNISASTIKRLNKEIKEMENMKNKMERGSLDQNVVSRIILDNRKDFRMLYNKEAVKDAIKSGIVAINSMLTQLNQKMTKNNNKQQEAMERIFTSAKAFLEKEVAYYEDKIDEKQKKISTGLKNVRTNLVKMNAEQQKFAVKQSLNEAELMKRTIEQNIKTFEAQKNIFDIGFFKSLDDTDAFKKRIEGFNRGFHLLQTDIGNGMSSIVNEIKGYENEIKDIALQRQFESVINVVNKFMSQLSDESIAKGLKVTKSDRADLIDSYAKIQQDLYKAIYQYNILIEKQKNGFSLDADEEEQLQSLYDKIFGYKYLNEIPDKLNKANNKYKEALKAVTGEENFNEIVSDSKRKVKSIGKRFIEPAIEDSTKAINKTYRDSMKSIGDEIVAQEKELLKGQLELISPDLTRIQSDMYDIEQQYKQSIDRINNITRKEADKSLIQFKLETKEYDPDSQAFKEALKNHNERIKKSMQKRNDLVKQADAEMVYRSILSIGNYTKNVIGMINEMVRAFDNMAKVFSDKTSDMSDSFKAFGGVMATIPIPITQIAGGVIAGIGSIMDVFESKKERIEEERKKMMEEERQRYRDWQDGVQSYFDQLSQIDTYTLSILDKENKLTEIKQSIYDLNQKNLEVLRDGIAKQVERIRENEEAINMALSLRGDILGGISGWYDDNEDVMSGLLDDNLEQINKDIGKIIDAFDAKYLATGNEKFLNWANSLRDLGTITEDNLIDLFKLFPEMTGLIGGFYDDFFSDTDKFFDKLNAMSTEIGTWSMTNIQNILLGLQTFGKGFMEQDIGRDVVDNFVSMFQTVWETALTGDTASARALLDNFFVNFSNTFGDFAKQLLFDTGVDLTQATDIDHFIEMLNSIDMSQLTDEQRQFVEQFKNIAGYMQGLEDFLDVKRITDNLEKGSMDLQAIKDTLTEIIGNAQDAQKIIDSMIGLEYRHWQIKKRLGLVSGTEEQQQQDELDLIDKQLKVYYELFGVEEGNIEKLLEASDWNETIIALLEKQLQLKEDMNDLDEEAINNLRKLGNAHVNRLLDMIEDIKYRMKTGAISQSEGNLLLQDLYNQLFSASMRAGATSEMLKGIADELIGVVKDGMGEQAFEGSSGTGTAVSIPTAATGIAKVKDDTLVMANRNEMILDPTSSYILKKLLSVGQSFGAISDFSIPNSDKLMSILKDSFSLSNNRNTVSEIAKDIISNVLNNTVTNNISVSGDLNNANELGRVIANTIQETLYKPSVLKKMETKKRRYGI